MSNRRGFTFLEVIVVVAIIGVLASVTAQRIGPALSGYSVRSARTVLASMVQRTRIHAVEGEGLARFRVDFVGDSAWIDKGSERIDTYRFRDELGVDLRSGVNAAWVCMNAKGIGDPRCTSFNSRLGITLVLNADTARMDVLPLGQVILQ